ncbi:hypothetical protein [Oxalicibacterium faecigallinarum]|uniref:DUF2845 domain-containing protein n=1 Tax=Oxalicibacterium faecigallinarum TaxID=573741 RepID=A0A8J3AUQ9_9BURK|nr:hypothetical protein [Oxalicibacterium faecigallinarum]GGI21413.1 hypothetical protein GCM10008066_28940 [Oxalicibacterium faecigallinarum]
MSMRHIVISCALAAAMLPAHAFERPFPPITKRGEIMIGKHPQVVLDGKDRTLSPGAWIRNKQNLIEMPVALYGRKFTVNYTENMEGNIDRVWILSDEEIKKPLPKRDAAK